MKRPLYTKANFFRGMSIYAAGDTIAAVLLGDFSVTRMFGMMLIGSVVYGFEIPRYFQWIDKRTAESQGPSVAIKKTTLALLYFNPLWIARHLFFIKLFTPEWAAISWGLLIIGLWSFLANIPIAVGANYLIQNHISLRWRFFASALFSALMAIYYALSEVLFS